jgi:endonuclease III
MIQHLKMIVQHGKKYVQHGRPICPSSQKNCPSSRNLCSIIDRRFRHRMGKILKDGSSF